MNAYGIPRRLGYALAENTSALKFFSELSPDRQREFIALSEQMTTPVELKTFVRRMTGLR